MIYALDGPDVSETDRRALREAISDSDAALVAGFADRGLVVHVMDATDARAYSCIWCGRPVRPSRANQPGRAREPWHFDHERGHGGRCSAPEDLPSQGCYIQLGREDEERFGRRHCKCIAEPGRTYCHHATSPGDGGASCMA